MNKSDELAKLLGIEPEILLKYLIGDDYFEGQGTKEERKEHKNDMLQRSPINGKEVKILEEIEIYPDFELPSNFVKLLRIQGNANECSTIASVYNSCFKNFAFENSLITQLIDIFTQYGVPEYTKQQARQIEWD